jgi:hypothetical protein
MMNRPQSLSLHDALKSSYQSPQKQSDALGKYGYQRDKDLSNHNQQVYYNKGTNKMLYTIAGTHNLRDWGTDAYLAAGRLKDTNRYKEADNILKRAQDKYKGAKTSIAGHSLGGTIAQYLHNRADKTLSLDAGYTVGQKTRGQHFRAAGDVVSLLGSMGKHTTTVKGGRPFDVLGNHDVGKIRDAKIFV